MFTISIQCKRKQILYGLPVAPNKVADLSELWDKVTIDGGIVRLLVDHPDQIKFLEEFENGREQPRKWSVFVKIDGGQRYENRFGFTFVSHQFVLQTSWCISCLAVFSRVIISFILFACYLRVWVLWPCRKLLCINFVV